MDDQNVKSADDTQGDQTQANNSGYEDLLEKLKTEEAEETPTPPENVDTDIKTDDNIKEEADENEQEEAPIITPISDKKIANGEMKEMADKVSQSLAELEELKAEKNALDQQLSGIQKRHEELEEKIISHQKEATEILKKLEGMLS